MEIEDVKSKAMAILNEIWPTIESLPMPVILELSAIMVSMVWGLSEERTNGRKIIDEFTENLKGKFLVALMMRGVAHGRKKEASGGVASNIVIIGSNDAVDVDIH